MCSYYADVAHKKSVDFFPGDEVDFEMTVWYAVFASEKFHFTNTKQQEEDIKRQRAHIR